MSNPSSVKDKGAGYAKRPREGELRQQTVMRAGSGERVRQQSPREAVTLPHSRLLRPADPSCPAFASFLRSAALESPGALTSTYSGPVPSLLWGHAEWARFLRECGYSKVESENFAAIIIRLPAPTKK